jgi:hypothetical protein
MITRLQSRLSVYLFFLIFSPEIFSQEKKEYEIAGIAFYNVENLFDTENHPFTFDDDRTPEGKDAWTEEKYAEKLQNLARVLSEIGKEVTGSPPLVIGICEIENRRVLEDLVNEKVLKDWNYDIVHYDSPDRRGVDVALLYRKDLFKPIHSQSRTLWLYEKDKRIFSRDQLVVSGNLLGEKIHFIVNHWPSRSGGEARSSFKREKAAALNRKIIDSIFQLEPYAKIVTMGDFNDDPGNKSLRRVLGAEGNLENVKFQGFYNPMAGMHKMGLGSLAYRDGWNLFDQIIISSELLQSNYETFRYYKAGIFNPNYLLTPKGQFKGYPFRSYGMTGYEGGYSDHFPVYMYLIRQVQPLEASSN